MISEVANVVEEFIGSVDETIARFNAAREAIAPKLEEALERYVERVERDARAGLNRPSWALSRSISSKIKSYQGGQTLWSIVGAKRETKSPRDPGVYWKYHESGWLPAGRKQRSPSRFLRTAKDRHVSELEKEVDAAYEEIREIYKNMQ